MPIQCAPPDLCGKLAPLMLLWASWLIFPAQANTTAVQDLTQLQRQAEQWLRAQLTTQEDHDVTVRAHSLDSRVRLTACTQALSFSDAPGQRSGQKTSVTVVCPDKPGWRLFLPVTVTRQRPVWVANQTISAGMPLSAAQWQRQTRDVASLPCAALMSDNLSAYEARITLASGTVLCESALKPKTLIERGQTIRLISELQRIRVSVAVEALDSGGLGERIRVKNSQTGKVIDGIIEGTERVRTP